jgi:arylformamidase
LESVARAISVEDTESIKPDDLVKYRIRPGERILFKTKSSERAGREGPFAEDFVDISEEAARFLARSHVRLVGVDYLSVGGLKSDGASFHKILLTAGMWIIEGLDLFDVEAGRYDLLCLPLRIVGGDGAPARVAVRRLKG